MMAVMNRYCCLVGAYRVIRPKAIEISSEDEGVDEIFDGNGWREVM
jgi:hypothetical protein